MKVFPARAGMIPASDMMLAVILGIPRESGDDPGRTITARIGAKYSPRERG